MKWNSEVKWAKIRLAKDSLYTLFASGQTTGTTLYQDRWKSLLSNSWLESKCKKEGFNLQTLPTGTKVRLGITKNKKNCKGAVSWLGFGGQDRSCGNFAHGHVDIRSFGYILIA